MLYFSERVHFNGILSGFSSLKLKLEIMVMERKDYSLNRWFCNDCAILFPFEIIGSAKKILGIIIASVHIMSLLRTLPFALWLDILLLLCNWKYWLPKDYFPFLHWMFTPCMYLEFDVLEPCILHFWLSLGRKWINELRF